MSFRRAARWLRRQVTDAALTDRRIFARVHALALREGATVIPWQKQHVETCGERTVAGDYSARHDVVRMFPGYHRDPWVLAHELGHRAAIRRGDHSEEAADGEGRRVVLSVLGPREVEAVRWRIDAMLPEDRRVGSQVSRAERRARKIEAVVRHWRGLARNMAAGAAVLATVSLVSALLGRSGWTSLVVWCAVALFLWFFFAKVLIFGVRR